MLCSSQVTPHSGAEVPPENSAGQVVCLVSHGQSNKIIKVGGSKKLEDVRRSLGKSEFGQLCDASFIIQVSAPIVRNILRVVDKTCHKWCAR